MLLRRQERLRGSGLLYSLRRGSSAVILDIIWFYLRPGLLTVLHRSYITAMLEGRETVWEHRQSLRALRAEVSPSRQDPIELSLSWLRKGGASCLVVGGAVSHSENPTEEGELDVEQLQGVRS